MEEGSGSLTRRSNCRAKGAAPGFKVAVLGASGGIGQPLALLMKISPLVSVLHLYDVVNTPGVTADISHMNTAAVVCSSTLPLLVLYLSKKKLLFGIDFKEWIVHVGWYTFTVSFFHKASF
jgi:hypothetical protein